MGLELLDLVYRLERKFDTPRPSPPHFALTRCRNYGLRLILTVRAWQVYIHAGMMLDPAWRRQANSSRFPANRRKSKSPRPQFVVVISEECLISRGEYRSC